ncbi:MAG: threonylcarbamoyl-AMP synthase [Parcubacteria group bacterium]|nr:threonylcarbamoyl-AMP synthase [Parcubacteria group bacterium]
MEIVKVDLKSDFSEAIDEVIAVLKLGGTIIYPTDTLYALGANAMEPAAVERIFKIKNRAIGKPLPLAVRNIKWAKELAFIYKKEEKILNSVWPGAVTVVLPKRNIVSEIITAGQYSVALRAPNSSFVDKLLGRYGYPLTSTSANLSGEEAPKKISEIIEMFEGNYYRPDLVIDAGDLPKSEPSTILDLTTDRPKILRVGPVKPETLRKLLEI